MRIKVISLAAFALLALACSGGQETAAPAVEPVAATPAETPAVDDAASHEILLATLKAADLADGTEDKVVARCVGCSLAMEGSADHVLQHEGYELHLCSDTCEEKFADDTAEALMAVEIPAAETE